MTAPLRGIRVVDLGGIGPGPFAAMILADLGAEVIRLERPSDDPQPPNPVLDRGKRQIMVDLKAASGRDIALRLLAGADASIEGFRPGVAEKLGVGPVEAIAANPRLVYGRMTGYGQEGPLSRTAGHDVNYIALSGLLGSLGPADAPPAFPANLLGDFGGGGMFLALGIMAGILRARAGGAGTVIDAAMVDGSSVLWSMMHGFEAMGMWSGGPGENYLDGGAPYYRVYETSDASFVAVGALEPQFFEALVETLRLREQLPGIGYGEHEQQRHWPRIGAVLREAFRARTRAEITALFDGVEACVTPVLSRDEAEQHLHNRHRSLLLRDREAVRHPAPAPRFGEVDGEQGRVNYPAPQLPEAAHGPGQDTWAILTELGIPPHEIAAMIVQGVVNAQPFARAS